jgi:hypothetical protein
MTSLRDLLVLVLFAASIAWANAAGPFAGLTGALGEDDCASCHGNSTGAGTVRIQVVPQSSSYTPSQTIRLRVTIEDPSAIRWGFQLTARSAANPSLAAGRLVSVDGQTQVETVGRLDYISQTTVGTQRNTRTSASWEFNWAAPSAGTNRVTFFVAGLAANGNGSDTGDRVYLSSFTLAEGFSGDGLEFVPVNPCRVLDTRNDLVLSSLSTREVPVPNSGCGVPQDAAAYSLNVTVVPRGSLGYLTAWPTGQPRPVVSTLNSLDGRIKANAAIVPAGASGSISIFVTDATEVILDINGYFVPPHSASMGFVATSPCRLLDTRPSNGLLALERRSIQVRNSPCVSADAAVYVLNATVIPAKTLGYLTLWPSGLPRPTVSTLNATTGTIVANAAIVPASATGSIDVFATDTTHLVFDIVGYFVPPGRLGLRFHTVTPCRVLDTRNPNGPLGGPALSAAVAREFPVPTSACGVPSEAAAYSLNATVWPSGPMGYLTLWPAGENMPLASTLNAFDGALTSNAAILRAGSGTGAIRAFGLSETHFLVDINGYFK